MLIEKISSNLKIDIDYINIISRRNNSYKRYFIKKKNGGLREIFHPSKELKILQYWICEEVFNRFPVSQYSQAYNKGCSTKKNAIIHKNNNYFLHTDIKNFFPSIKRNHLEKLFKENKEICTDLNLSISDIEFICDVVLYSGKHLVVGSVSSPQISNNVMYSFDLETAEILKKEFNCVYTRYADDILVSSKKYIPDKCIEILNETMKQNDFSMNMEKTYYMNKRSRRQVTGIVVDNNSGNLSIGNKKYKSFQRELYNYLIKNEGSIKHIKGYLSYIKGTNSKQFDNLVKIYKKYDSKNEIF